MVFLFLINGIGNFYREGFSPVSTIIGVIIIAIAMFEFIYGYITFSKSSKYAPRVEINDNEIKFKNRHFKPSIQIKWSDVKNIEFGSYKIIFKLFDEKIFFTFESSPATSVEIKEIIRTMAEEKGISIVHG